MYENLKAFFAALSTDPQKLADFNIDREAAMKAAGLTEEEMEVFRIDINIGPCTSVTPTMPVTGEKKMSIERSGVTINIHFHDK